MAAEAAVKTSALALIPEERVWPAIQALRLAHDKQVNVWPPHINILYPFVPEHDFDQAGERLVDALKTFGPLPKLRFTRKGHFGSTAILLPEECSGDDALARLHAACRAAFPELPPSRDFKPHLTIGQFQGEAECKAFLDRCPPLDLWADVDLCLLARPGMQQPFRTVSRVQLGDALKSRCFLAPGDPHPYAFRSTEGRHRSVASTNRQEAFYQVDDSHARFVFKVEKEALKGNHHAEARQTLFVVDNSGSMRAAFDQVKSAAQYMASEVQKSSEMRGTDHEVGFVVYNDKAATVSAADVGGLRANGGTSFEAAFAQIRQYILGRPLVTSLMVVFMTDGRDNRAQNLAKSTQEFADFLKTCGRQVVVHAIGFTPDHNREFLQTVCTTGTSEGMYRYASTGGGKALETRFSEMFDFLDVNVNMQLRIGDAEFPCSGQECGGSTVRFDVFLPASQLILSEQKDALHVTVGNAHVVLEKAKIDPMFTIRCVDEMEISTQGDLNKAQEALSSVQICKVQKALRQEAADARENAQARLDKYHELFAQGARSKVAAGGGNLAAELSSLRHEATFSKARRARAMAQRAVTNASSVELLEQLLQTLPAPTDAEVEAIEAQQLACSLSGETAADIMRDSHRDFFVFSMRVRRPEDVIDAPTVLDLQQVLSGVYSNEAFRSAAEYALRTTGPQSSHGGFAGSTKQPLALGENVGLFRGPDGQQMNACLPLYLNEAHFARVRVQIKPILGYFFTLDPLGYKGDQTIALFGLLGTMVCHRANKSVEFTGSWADWVVDDFTKLCQGIRPIAMEYLSQGNYTGVVRGDLLDDFLASPAGRTNQRVPSLGVLIGWAAAVGAAEPSKRFYMAFVEELWRRNFTALNKGQPREPILEILERLLYGPEPGADGEGESETQDGVAKNAAAKDKEFAQWGRLKMGNLSKKEAEQARKKFRNGPEVEGLMSANTTYAPQAVLTYEDAPEYFDKVVETELAKIRRHNGFTAALYQGRPFGDGFTGAEKRLMLIQALQYTGNDAMNDAVEKSRYVDTFNVCSDNLATAESQICGPLHQRFDGVRQEKYTACVDKRNALITARHIVATTSLDAFVGRCAVSCPTRGGAVFENVVALIGSGAPAPLLAEKVDMLMTGTVDGMAVLAEGSSWVHCPLETAKRFQEAVGEEAFVEMELKMRGTWGHVYRESDLPNRHGHCNSNPNSDLVVKFSGFRLAVDGAA